MRIHASISETSWTSAAALARFCLACAGDRWADSALSGAALRNAERALGGMVVDEKVLGPEWSRLRELMRRHWPDSQAAVWSTGMHPLAWLRWAHKVAAPPLAASALLVAMEWNCAEIAHGQLVVMRGTARKSKPSLRRFGMKGHGWPVALFVVAEIADVDLNDRWDLKRYAVGEHDSATATLESATRPLRGSAAVAGRRSRGKGVEDAVEAALLAFFVRANDMQRLHRPNLDNGPRYQVDNLSRQDLVKQIRVGCKPLKKYSDSTVIAELSRWVKFPRGRPVHR